MLCHMVHEKAKVECESVWGVDKNQGVQVGVDRPLECNSVKIKP